MTSEQFKQFIDEIIKNKKVWLLQSKPGLFAMVEDSESNSYIPIWESENKAQAAATDDWSNYQVDSMNFNELAVWLKELKKDDINITVSPDGHEQSLALRSSDLQHMVSQYVTETFIDYDPEESDIE